jgi:hypothetical protein
MSRPKSAFPAKVGMPLSHIVENALLGRLLYVSTLAAGVPVKEVSRIVGVSRPRNAGEAITGLLIFDGDTFCQYVEGPPEAVDALLQRLRRDPRHDDMQVLLDGTWDGARRFSDWRLGYVDSFEADELGTLRGLRGDAALACFEDLLPRLDVSA